MGMELTVIAAVVIGGTLLTGGEGYVFGALFGVLIIGVIQSLIQFNGQLSSWWTPIVVGALMLVFIGVQSFLSRAGADPSIGRVGGPRPPRTTEATIRRPRIGRDEAPLGRSAIVAVAPSSLGGCGYIVVPPEASAPVGAGVEGLDAPSPTSVEPGDGGDLQVELTHPQRDRRLERDAGRRGKPAVLTDGDGKTTDCATVVVGTGGHRSPRAADPGLPDAGRRTQPTTELIRVECAGATAGPGAKLAHRLQLRHRRVQLLRARRDADRGEARGRPRSRSRPDLSYPVAEPVDGVVQPADIEIAAINDVSLTLIARRADGRRASSSTGRPTNPERVPDAMSTSATRRSSARDGVIYGFYESPDLADGPDHPGRAVGGLDDRRSPSRRTSPGCTCS